MVDILAGLCAFHVENGEKANRPTHSGGMTTTITLISLDEDTEEPDAEDESSLVIKPTVLGTIVKARVNRIRPLPGQPRVEFDLEELRLLAESIREVGQLMPALLYKVSDDSSIDFQLIDGERRWRACQLGGMVELVGIYYEGLSVTDAEQLYYTSAIANFGQSPHTPLERAFAAQRFMRGRGLSVEQVARLFCTASQTLQRDLRLLKLDAGVQKLMRKDRPLEDQLSLGAATRLVDYPAAFQVEAAEQIVRQRLDAGAATLFIRRYAIEKGVQADRKRPGRRTADDATNITRALAQMNKRLDELSSIPDVTVGEALKRSKPATRTSVLNTIRELERKLQAMREEIEATRVKKAA